MIANIWTPACGAENYILDELQMHLVQNAASARNIRVRSVASPTTSLTHAGTTHHFIRHRPDTLTYFARQVSNSKVLTKAFLREAGLEVPRGRLFEREEMGRAWRFAKTLGLPVVIKPLAGSKGNGVTANITDQTQFEAAWENVPPNHRRIVVEKHHVGQDYRVIIIGKHHAGTLLRQPPIIVGDGRKTVAQLVDDRREKRKENAFTAGLEFGLTPTMRLILANSGYDEDTVLPAGVEWKLHDIANVSAGGDCIDVSAEVHDDFVDLARRATYAVPGMMYCGIDFLVEDISKPASAQNYTITEVNSTPDLGMHHYPTVGTKRDLYGALLEELFPLARILPPDAWMKKILTVGFQGSYSAFCEALRLHVFQNCVAGRVEQSGHDTAIIEAACPPNACRRFVRQVSAMHGVSVSQADGDGPPPEGFAFHEGRTR